MRGHILQYSLLALLWTGLTIAIFMGLHERFLGAAEEWKRYLAMSICGLMVLWNVARITMILQSRRAKAPPDDFPR
jgi:hypothetical protein